MAAISRRTFVAGLLTGLKPAVCAAQGPASLPEAIGVLAHEKSAAEQYAVILATVGKKDMATYLHGITLYANAKADFDGLIEELIASLRSGVKPGTSERFKKALDAAAQKRISFTDFVTNDIVGKIEGAKPGLPSIITLLPDLIKAITDAGLAIWNAFHSAAKEKQDAILEELERQKWKLFADIASG